MTRVCYTLRSACGAGCENRVSARGAGAGGQRKVGDLRDC